MKWENQISTFTRIIQQGIDRQSTEEVDRLFTIAECMIQCELYSQAKDILSSLRIAKARDAIKACTSLILKEASIETEMHAIDRDMKISQKNKEEFYDGLQKIKWKIHSITEQIEKLEMDRRKKQMELDELQMQLNNLRGLFTKKKKETISEQIEQARKELGVIDETIQKKGEEESQPKRELITYQQCHKKAFVEDAREFSYRKGLTYLKYGRFLSAYRAFKEIKGYKDADDLVESHQGIKSAVAAEEELISEYLKHFEKDELITFGSYTPNKLSKKQFPPLPIEWKVVSKRDIYRLLLCEYCVDLETYTEISSWNSHFYDHAFSSEEKQRIAYTRRENLEFWVNYGDDRTHKSYDIGPATDEQEHDEDDDKVFLMSHSELERYTHEYRPSALPTKYVRELLNKATASDIEKNELKDKKQENCPYWVRPDDVIDDTARIIDARGEYQKTWTYNQYFGVRPAIWIKID